MEEGNCNNLSYKEVILRIIEDIRRDGFSKVLPFSIGKVENRMSIFAKENNIELASDDIYMSSKQIAHSMRDSKASKGLVVSDKDLADFPMNRTQMDLFYDGECFIYTDYKSKFVLHPNYEMKIDRNKVRKVNFITTSSVSDGEEFKMQKYQKI